MDRKDLERRIKPHQPDRDALDRIAQMHRFALDFSIGVLQMVPDGHEKEQALINIEQTLFWANAGIARDPNHWAGI